MNRLLSLLFSILVIASCGSDDEGTSTNCTSTVEQSRVLARYADLIENRASGLVANAVQLDGLAEQYLTTPSEQRLEDLKDAYIEVSEAWLFTEPFAFGPDGALLVSMEINPFPVDESAVDAHVSEGSFDESLSSNFDRGLPALDYLLFNGTTTDVHQNLATNAGARQVIADVSSAILSQSNVLLNTWKDAESTFTVNTGTAAGSGLSVLINAVSKHFEDTRRDRIGTPFGVTTLGFPNPQTVEAPYSEKSLEWLERSIEASKSAFLATDPTSTQNLPSLAEYFSGLSGSDATQLVDDIESQYTLMLVEVADIDGPLKAAVEQDVDDVQEAYNAISRQVVNLKTDVPSVACVSITYVDNPSDSD